MLFSSFRRRHFALLLALAVLGLSSHQARAQKSVKRIVLQGFWWDYYNENYRFKWADYLAELAPRLKAIGIDAVWIPPTPKNKNATNDVGYSPFDHYDLGDKFQKGNTGTRFGTKDEFLRMVAVLHANGIEVVQDVVLNHADGAGTATGAGGIDPAPSSVQSNSGYKNFRYASYATPLPEAGETAADYLSRRGRWPKNFPNFHPHAGHATTDGDMAAPWFGPDFCYGDDGGSDGYGPSTNATYNPPQAPGYSRNQARDWILWLKRQTGVDGFRWDATKHFSYPVQQDLSYNLKYLNGAASAGETMFNVGEYVGDKGALDYYVQQVNAQNGGGNGDFLLGTFDFGLRGAIYGMVSGNGGYDLAQLPGQQQERRTAYYGSSQTTVHRTVPFVNNHDTFRPRLNDVGNYVGWNTGSELAPHIDPFNERLSAAYAIALALDGSPQIFFEDLFNVGGTGKRWSHVPGNAADLPLREDLVNLIWCHQHLGFKDGAYKVRAGLSDHLVIERSGKVLIGINDHQTAWQHTEVATDFAPGTRLIDYSGANGTAVHVVQAGGQVRVSTPPCDGSALRGRRGYAVWAPEGQGSSPYTPPHPPVTTQEWEMADDLGDQHCQSLGQGGRLPDYSTNSRLVGKIYAQAGQPVTYTVRPAEPGNSSSLTIGVYDLRGNRLSTALGSGEVTNVYTPATTGWLALKVANTSNDHPGQSCFVQATYTAPAAVDTRAAGAARNEVAIWTGNNHSGDPGDCRNWENGVEPGPTTDVLIPAGSSAMPELGAGLLLARSLTVEAGATLTLAAGTTLRLTGNLTNNGTLAGPGALEMAGTTPQYLLGAGSLSRLVINNPADVRLLSPLTLAGSLSFAAGHLLLNEQALTLAPAATIDGARAGRYVVTGNAPASRGALVRTGVAGSALTFPVGTAASYTPLTLRPTGETAASFRVRTFGAVLNNGSSGVPYARASEFVNRTWEVQATPATAPADLTLQWNGPDANADFQPARATVYRHGNGTWQALPTEAAAPGSYAGTVRGLTSFGLFSVGNGLQPLPVQLVAFGARRAGGDVVLTWVTASELRNQQFDVEKATVAQPAFQRTGLVPGQGTTSGRHEYSFRDAEPGAAYYRLRQLDTDGTAHYGPVATVAAYGTPTFSLYPNPAPGAIVLQGPTDAPLRATLTTLYGQLVGPPVAGSLTVVTGQLNTALQTAAAGVYVVTLEYQGQKQHLKLVKE